MKKTLLASLLLLLMPTLALAQTPPSCAVNQNPDSTLTWDAQGSIMDVVVERQLNAGPWTKIAQVTPPGLTPTVQYVDKETSPTVLAGNIASYRVKFAFPDGTFSPYGNVACKDFRRGPVNLGVK